MASEKIKPARFFELRRFPMDFARVNMALLPLIYRVRAWTPTGEKYKKKIRGGAIIAANHYDFSDPLVLFITFWYRRVFFLAGELVMNGSLRSKMLAGLGAIRIDRNIADMEAIRRCVRLLKEGRMLGVFPQGQLTKTQEVSDIKHGAVLMALQSGVPIVPMYIQPQDKWYRGRDVVIGDPIDPKALCTKKIPSTADIQRISEHLAEEMNRCIRKDPAVEEMK